MISNGSVNINAAVAARASINISAGVDVTIYDIVAASIVNISAAGTIIIDVSTGDIIINSSASVDAGADITVNAGVEGAEVQLDASGSYDVDGDELEYYWSWEIAGEIYEANGVNPIIELPVGVHTIELIVNDGIVDSEPGGVIVTIVLERWIEVSVDIKPGSCPNPLNVKSSGVLPIAILGTDDYDITTIDPTSIRLAGVEPIRSSYEDVATPVSDTNDCNCTEEGPDGFLDLTLKFKTQRIVEAVGDVNDGDVRVLTLTGVLFDPMPFETPIEGADCILIRGRHKPINPADINKDGVVNAADFAIFAQNWLQSSIVDE
jgi:hypothetical protein